MTGVSASFATPRSRVWEPEVAREPSASGRILLVEDDDHVRLVLALALELAGHEVHAAANAAEALSLSERLAFDLVATDVGLPGASGVELARRLAQGGVEAVLFITGH